MYLVADAERAGGGLLTLFVDDLDEQLAQLESRGIKPAEIETIPGAARKATIVDPEGNSIAFAQLAPL